MRSGDALEAAIAAEPAEQDDLEHHTGAGDGLLPKSECGPSPAGVAPHDDKAKMDTNVAFTAAHAQELKAAQAALAALKAAGGSKELERVIYAKIDTLTKRQANSKNLSHSAEFFIMCFRQSLRTVLTCSPFVVLK